MSKKVPIKEGDRPFRILLGKGFVSTVYRLFEGLPLILLYQYGLHGLTDILYCKHFRLHFVWLVSLNSLYG